ncbi:hypothetical protein [Streptomyces sp. SID10815]|uniref:hypothetical protein n=1 Tax=Streptomyces sp. SID10815 TaxID=2706027 RepID=UPI0013CB97C0|nr:hypothetical protein [Streptomyces sp. SID10815]NEA52413.1 hypothetical protein [Streptomyces sp. SID10815]
MLKPLRRLTGQSGPACDRCGKPTWKPSLYYVPSQNWRCEPCEAFVAKVTAMRLMHSQPATGEELESLVAWMQANDPATEK